MISKKYLIPMAAIAVIGAAALGATAVSAAEDKPQSSLVQKIADTFKLDQSKVQAVFDEDRKSRVAEREANYEERLSQAVTDGQLTKEQKDKVLAKHKELKAKIDALLADDSLDTKEERRTALEKIRTEATDWAKANSIDAKWLLFGGGHGRGKFGPGGHGPGGHGFGGPDIKGGFGHHGPNENDDTTASPSPSASPSA